MSLDGSPLGSPWCAATSNAANRPASNPLSTRTCSEPASSDLWGAGWLRVGKLYRWRCHKTRPPLLVGTVTVGGLGLSPGGTAVYGCSASEPEVSPLRCGHLQTATTAAGQRSKLGQMVMVTASPDHSRVGLR